MQSGIKILSLIVCVSLSVVLFASCLNPVLGRTTEETVHSGENMQRIEKEESSEPETDNSMPKTEPEEKRSETDTESDKNSVYTAFYDQDELTQAIRDSLQNSSLDEWTISLERNGKEVNTYQWYEAANASQSTYYILRQSKVFHIHHDISALPETRIILSCNNWKITAYQNCDFFRYEDGKTDGYAISCYEYDTNAVNEVFSSFQNWLSFAECERAKNIQIVSDPDDYTQAAEKWLKQYETNILAVDPLCDLASTWIQTRIVSLNPCQENDTSEDAIAVYDFSYAIDRVPLNGTHAGSDGHYPYQGTNADVPENAWTTWGDVKFVFSKNGYWYVKE